MALLVNPRAAAVNFTFNNSCNCCRFCKPKIKNHYFVYVHSDASVELYKLKKADEESFIRTIQNVRDHIRIWAHIRDKCAEEIMEAVERECNISLDPLLPTPLTVGMVAKINEVLEMNLIPPDPSLAETPV